MKVNKRARCSEGSRPATIQFKLISQAVAGRALAHSLAQQCLLPLLPKALNPAISSAIAAAAALPELLLRMVLAVPSWAAPTSLLPPELPTAPWQMEQLDVCGISLKSKRQLQKRAKGEIPKAGISGSSLDAQSSQGEFQAASSMLIYLKLRAGACWKWGNSPCLVWVRVPLGLILNRVKSCIFQPSGGSIWTFCQEAVAKQWHSLGLVEGNSSPWEVVHGRHQVSSN